MRNKVKVKLSVLLNAPNDFTCGDCKKCPIHKESYYDNHYSARTTISCLLGYNAVNCPLEILTEGTVSVE